MILSARIFRPDLADAMLEDRTLMAYSPFVPQFVLTTGGYVGLTTPPGLSANLSTMGGGGAVGGGGGNMGTGYYVTGFGTSLISIGNATGFAGVGGASGSSSGGTIRPTVTVGSGAAEGGGAASVSRNTVAQGPVSDDVLNTLYIGRTSSSSDVPAGGYAGPGTRPEPIQGQPPVPPAPPPS